MRRAIVVGVFALLLALPAAAQVRDTVVITIDNRATAVTIAAVKLDGSAAGSHFITGDTIQFVAKATDAAGDTVGGIATWWTNKPTFVQVDSVKGLAVMLKKATPADNVLIIVQFSQVNGASTAFFRPAQGSDPGEFTWVGRADRSKVVRFPALQGEGQLCAYLTYDGAIVAQSPAPCPEALGSPPSYQVSVDGQTYQAPRAWKREGLVTTRPAS